MSGHIKEPWVATGYKVTTGYREEFGGSLFVASALTAQDARRIVACVNACAGIPLNMLESAGQSAVIALRPVDELVAERNELMAALQDVCDYWDAKDGGPSIGIRVQRGRDAIAKVKS